jgi:hypothetical protein
MKELIKGFITLFLFLMSSLICNAQCTGAANGCAPGVPHFIKLTGLMKNIAGVPHPGILAVKFVIYDAPTDGNALWQEVQNVPVDIQGHYELMLGSTAHEGVPTELFTSGESRWLGVQALSPGSQEEPRILMVSVPYALEAADAQTLGGLPASAFARISAPTVLEGSASVDATSANSAHAAAGSTVAQPASLVPALTGSPNSVPKFSTATSLVDSQITDSNGAVSMQNLANTLFADRFPGGVADAVVACPISGCIINATSPNVNLNLGTIDPGTKAITIYLGPYSYTIKQVTLRKALRLSVWAHREARMVAPRAAFGCHVTAPLSHLSTETTRCL